MTLIADDVHEALINLARGQTVIDDSPERLMVKSVLPCGEVLIGWKDKPNEGAPWKVEIHFPCGDHKCPKEGHFRGRFPMVATKENIMGIRTFLETVLTLAEDLEAHGGDPVSP